MAWKKNDEYPQPEPPPPVPRPAGAPAPEPQRRADRSPATIGPSIFIKGDLNGEEDLVIEGKVEGKIDLKTNHVTVGKNGRVRADIFGKVVIIEGEVDGNVFAVEQAILRQSGAVRGNITSPRVILEDGSRFRGSIDMEPKEPSRPLPALAVPEKAGAGALRPDGADGVRKHPAAEATPAPAQSRPSA